MATITKIRRVANPSGRRRRFSARRNARRLTRNRLGHFVKRSTARRKRVAGGSAHRVHRSPVIRRYSAKVLKKELRRRGLKSNPARGGRRRTMRRRTARRSNPVLIELGMVNPRSGGTKRRKSSMAKRRYRKSNARRRRATSVVRRRRTHRRVNAHRTYRRRRRNPVAVAPVRRRRRRTTVRHARVRRYIRHRRHNRRYARRNPSIFGSTGSKDMLYMVGGGLIGVAAAKFLPTLVPASITGMIPSSPITSILITGAGAFAAGWLAHRFVGNKAFGDAVLFGGLMQVGNAVINAFAPPSVRAALALSGVGDIVPGWFAVPQNPVTNRAPMALAPAGVSGFAPGGFGFRRR